MDIRKAQALSGPNTWANFPVLEAWVDLGPLADRASNEIPGFNDRLMAWLPSMIEHRCSVGQRGGFFERLRRGTYLAHILEHTTLELQSLAGNDVGFGKARETTEPGVYRVVVEYEEEQVARECLEAARRLLLAAVAGETFDVAGEVARLRSLAQDVCLGPSTRAIRDAARARGIPATRLTDGSLLQLGYGSRQRRVWTAVTDRTGSIAQDIAQDKDLTRRLLHQGGVPVPAGRAVRDAEDAWAAAGELKGPVVVKPQDGNHGRGVATNLTTREQVLAAYAAAREESRSVIVEKFIPGLDHRLLVVGSRLAAAARREPAHVVGDGAHTIAELIDIVNADPRRGDDHATALSRIRVDAVALGVLAEQGFAPTSVPPAGQTVLIRRNGNLSTGGTAIDVTDKVHPEVAARAVEAARIVGLDIAGIDVLATDISRPLEEQGGAIVEVNAGPGLRMHLEPSVGTPRAVGEAIVDTLFPQGETGRIPIVAVTGVNGKTTVTRLVAHILRGTPRRVGMTCTDGIYLDDRRIELGDCSGPQSARAILSNPMIDAAVLETARGGILRAGLGFDRCDVAVVTNIGEGDHLGLCQVETLEALAAVKRVIVDVVDKEGAAVLNAADPLVVAMAEHCRGEVIFFAADGSEAALLRRRAAGGRVVFARAGEIVLAEGTFERVLVGLDRVPLTHRGRIGFEVENVLAAVAAAWALELPEEVILGRLASFTADMDHVPGRFNLFQIHGADVIVDYGHNVSALAALVEAIAQLPHARRTAVYTTAGDRRDCDILRQGQMLAEAFDRVILYEDHYIRGRQPGEITGLLRQGLAKGPRVSQVEEVRGAIAAVQTALESAAPGELLLIQADTIDETVDFMRTFLKANNLPAVPEVDVFADLAEEREEEDVEEAEATLAAQAARGNGSA